MQVVTLECSRLLFRRSSLQLRYLTPRVATNKADVIAEAMKVDLRMQLPLSFTCHSFPIVTAPHPPSPRLRKIPRNFTPININPYDLPLAGRSILNPQRSPHENTPVEPPQMMITVAVF